MVDTYEKGLPRTLLFGTHCEKLYASAKDASGFGGYASVRGFPDDSECLLHEDSESTGTGKTHSLYRGGAMRKCTEKHCCSASSILFDH